jgi:hypothetical protein
VNLAGQRSASFRRSEAGHWTVDGAEAPEVALDRLAAAAGQLFHSGPVASEPSAEHGLDPALIELQFTLLAAGDEATADSAPEQLVTLRIGREDADGASFATQSDWARPWVVRLTAGALEELLVALTEVVERSAFR